MSATEQSTFLDLAAAGNSQCEDADCDLCPSDASDWGSSLELSPRRQSVEKDPNFWTSGVCSSDKEMDKLITMFNASTSVRSIKTHKSKIALAAELPPPVRFIRKARKAVCNLK